MNLFVLDSDPYKAALYQNDKHVVKMTLETSQVLSTVHWLRDTEVKEKLYKPTHIKHPCVIWSNTSHENYIWSLHLFEALAQQYNLRFGKNHRSYALLYNSLNQIPVTLPRIGLTAFALAMPDKYKCEDPVLSYRKYYVGEKSGFSRWTHPGKVPDWYINLIKEKENVSRDV